MKEALKLFLFCCALFWLISAATLPGHNNIGVQASVAHFRVNSKHFAKTIAELGIALESVHSSDQATVGHANNALIKSRLAYKRIEYFLEYFFFTSSRIYNRAPKNEIEEPNLEYQEPAGFQYIEAMLSDSLPENHRTALQEQIRLLSLSANNLNSLLYQFAGNDRQILESIRLEVIRVISLGITGFDAPLLKSGITESKASLEAIAIALTPYLDQRKHQSGKLRFYLTNSIRYLDEHPDFNSFDRLEFLTENALPLQKQLGIMIRDMNLEMNTYGVLNYAADNLFSYNAFNGQSFPSGSKAISKKEITLGKKLFFEKTLSGNSSKTCASCHNPNHYFMDGLVKSIGFDPAMSVRRNAPTLLYSSLQHSQFWDGRARSLEEQIEIVIKDPLEMNGNMSVALQKINADKTYKKDFREAFGKQKNEGIKEQEIYTALAAYVKTLNLYTSPFDKYMKGNKSAMTTSQIAGFNLFMGKAQCGTCHFAPLFNGLIPPFYTLTEFEILGTTLTDNLAKAAHDPDEGRFSFRPTPFYKGAFKTPTVRNSEMTAPYMHNGAFKSLDTVMEFYNQGGGAGLGLELPNQTLSASKLNLSDQEKQNIIAFLKALTDDTSSLK